MENLDLNKLTNDQHNKIADVMDRFDFEIVAKYMKQVQWEWFMSGKYYVPDIIEIRKYVRKLLIETYNRLNSYLSEDPNYKGVTMTSTGGFTVYVHPDNECDVYFSIAFYNSGC